MLSDVSVHERDAVQYGVRMYVCVCAGAESSGRGLSDGRERSEGKLEQAGAGAWLVRELGAGSWRSSLCLMNEQKRGAQQKQKACTQAPSATAAHSTFLCKEDV